MRCSAHRRVKYITRTSHYESFTMSGTGYIPEMRIGASTFVLWRSPSSTLVRSSSLAFDFRKRSSM